MIFLYMILSGRRERERASLQLNSKIFLFNREYFYQNAIPANSSIHHRNGIPMDNRLTNLCLISNSILHFPLQSSSSTFYWQIISHLPVDMDEVDYHNSTIDQSSLYECHHAPCTQLLHHEQFICLQCKRIKYLLFSTFLKLLFS